jgi:hypothetical protein
MDILREEFIRTVWADKGRQAWNPGTSLGQALHLEGLSFWLTTTETPNGQCVPAVECATG